MQLWGWSSVLDAIQHFPSTGSWHFQCFGGTFEHGNWVSSMLLQSRASEKNAGCLDSLFMICPTRIYIFTACERWSYDRLTLVSIQFSSDSMKSFLWSSERIASGPGVQDSSTSGLLMTVQLPFICLSSADLLPCWEGGKCTLPGIGNW